MVVAERVAVAGEGIGVESPGLCVLAETPQIGGHVAGAPERVRMIDTQGAPAAFPRLQVELVRLRVLPEAAQVGSQVAGGLQGGGMVVASVAR